MKRELKAVQRVPGGRRVIHRKAHPDEKGTERQNITDAQIAAHVSQGPSR